MTLSVEQLFENLWQQYIQINPQAKKIEKLLSQRGEKVINDHIALRTFNTKKLGLAKIAEIFINKGYVVKQSYDFEQKKLNAIHLQHASNNQHPKVFISELRTELFSDNLQQIIADIDQQIDEDLVNSDAFITSGRSWNLNFEQYIHLLRESEYAAWTAAFGYRANHFTVSLNHLTTFFNLNEFNDFLVEQGFVLNSSSGFIKGSAEQYLEQSSTMAAPVSVAFDHSIHVIPGCFYEFAKRYPLPKTGQLFSGFVAASADKIFESTDRS